MRVLVIIIGNIGQACCLLAAQDDWLFLLAVLGIVLMVVPTIYFWQETEILKEQKNV